MLKIKLGYYCEFDSKLKISAFIKGILGCAKPSALVCMKINRILLLYIGIHNWILLFVNTWANFAPPQRKENIRTFGLAGPILFG